MPRYHQSPHPKPYPHAHATPHQRRRTPHDQRYRLQKHHETTPVIRASSLYWRYGGWVNRWIYSPIQDLLSLPIALLAMPPMPILIALLVAACIEGPSAWFITPREPTWAGYALLGVWAILVLNVVDYMLEVLMRVPWQGPRTYPLVSPLRGLPREDRRLAHICLWVAAICVLPALLASTWHRFEPLPSRFFDGSIWSGTGIAHTVSTGMVFFLFGTLLLWLFKREPAWPFVRWTSEDELIVNRQASVQHSAPPPQQQQAPQPWVPPNPAPAINPPTAPPPQAPAQAQPAARNDYPVPFTPRLATKRFADIHGMSELKDKLYGQARRIVEDVNPVEQANVPKKHPAAPTRNGILLHGEPGNGKTVFAEALAGELGVPFLDVTYGPMASKWIGEIPVLLTRTFELARASAPCVLFIDEIDSFIKSRDATTNNPEALIITNVMLTEMVKLRGTGVVLMAATNYLDTLDAAAIREGRFDFKLEVRPPDEAARIGLMQAGAKTHCGHLQVDAAQLVAVAKRWNGFSVARLQAVCQAMPDVARKRKLTHIGHAQWMLALREVQGRRGRVFDDAQTLSSMVFTQQTRASLDMLVGRLKHAATIEARGGSLPTGILFHGPAGTGKTATARALARAVDWAFLPVAGPDLVADRGKLAKLFAEAKDLRPTLIFIDEADDIVRDRRYCAHPELVNKLLSLMDGTEEKIKDLVWIAATNHPDQIDPALLRAGRFTEKILFSPPPLELVAGHIETWLKARSVRLTHAHAPAGQEQANVHFLAEELTGQSIANIEGLLQYALNAAIHRTSGRTGSTVIEVADINLALAAVLVQAPVA